MDGLQKSLPRVVLVVVALLPVVVQGQMELEWVSSLASPQDDIVVGSDGRQVIQRVRHGQDVPWSEAVTRLALVDGAPWKCTVPRDWDRKPLERENWTSVGDIVHVDIDPRQGMAVISTVQGGEMDVWLSAEDDQGTWTVPWPLPALAGWQGDAAFAMFDVTEGREGDVLLALRPQDGGVAGLEATGQWKGGFDVARVRRRGGYHTVTFLDAVNTSGDEWALAPHLTGGGWLSAERIGGAGGVDPWWCADIPLGTEVPDEAPDWSGHTMVFLCSGQPAQGTVWAVEDAISGTPVLRMMTDADGAMSMDRLPRDRDLDWKMVRNPPRTCPNAMLEWRDSDGRVVQRFPLAAGTWSVRMLAAMGLGAWTIPCRDASTLPTLASQKQEVEGPQWLVFHPAGSAALDWEDERRLTQWAAQLRAHPEDRVLVVGHASTDGPEAANVALAEERARSVAARLEFAGLPSSQIRFEGRGSRRPLTTCPAGMDCPEDPQARSRRTELLLLFGDRP